MTAMAVGGLIFVAVAWLVLVLCIVSLCKAGARDDRERRHW